jgi:hypothetical protein
MGQGRKRTADTPKARPIAGSGPGTGGGIATQAPTEFCQQVHLLDVVFDQGVSLQSGAAIRLALAVPPRVYLGQRSIGEVSDSLARGIEHCLEEGFAMTGTVQTFDPATRRGTIAVSGQKQN